jgi:indolepyruvate ferredoxin oxidoreductase
VGLLVGYPGSPVADVFEIAGRLSGLLSERGIVAQVANNEALAAARLNGSQMAPIRAMGFMKSVGGHVAADGLAITNLAGVHPHGGAIVVIGDDPWTDSTQVPADSRYLLEHLRIPVVEPATFQEVKDWIDLCFRLSNTANLLVGYRVTTNQADGAGVVCVQANRYPGLNHRHRISLDRRRISTDDRVMLAPDTARAEVNLTRERFPRVLEQARLFGLDQILYSPFTAHDSLALRQPLGIVTSGMAYNYVEHAFEELGIQGQLPMLKLGLVYPVDPEQVIKFASKVDELVVVEEQRDFIECQIVRILRDARQRGELTREVPVWGKQLPDGQPGFPSTRGLNPSLVIRYLGPTFGKLADRQREIRSVASAYDQHFNLDRDRLAEELTRIDQLTSTVVALPARTPTFCPGCPHRDSASVMKDLARDFENEQYMQSQHNCSQQDLIFHGDIGCYVMLKYDPYKRLMHNLSGMGLGGGTGAGIDPFIDNKQLVFMGDSTFFHSGMAAISDSIKNGQNITYVILDNKTTAMTGHQPTPAQEVDLMGHATMGQDVESIVRAMGTGRAGTRSVQVIRLNPELRERYREVVERAVVEPGVKVIVADKECAITAGRRLRAERRQIIGDQGFLAREQFINITPEVCEHCLECTNSTGCTGLTFVETDYGPKVATDRSFCVNDGACSKRFVCPSFERVEIIRKNPPVSAWPWSARDGDSQPAFPEPPEVQPAEFDRSYHVFVAGVGGMGVGTITAILARAAHDARLDCLLCDKKGLAIRNGGVYSRMVFSKDGARRSPLVPYGKADLMLALDLLEAARGVDPHANLCVAHPARTVALINSAPTYPVAALIGKEAFDANGLLATLRRYTRSDAFWAHDLFGVAERLLGHKLYANMLLLGLAYQRRLLPMTLGNLVNAMRATIAPAELEDNIRAFQLGRLLAMGEAMPQQLRRALARVSVNPQCTAELIQDKAAILRRSAWFHGRALAQAYEGDLANAFAAMPMLHDSLRRDLALRFYDLILYQNLAYARTVYLDKVVQTYRRDRADYGFEATQAVIWYLYKVLAIKDEVWVSHLLTSEEKRRRDYERYRIDPARGDRLRYVHLNRPEFNIFSYKLQFRIRSRTWMLRSLKRMKFLRRLPGWHVPERHFRDRYSLLVNRLRYNSKEFYDRLVEVLRLPEQVRGYVEVRYPTMVEPLRRIDALLNDPELSGTTADTAKSNAVPTPHFTEIVRKLESRHSRDRHSTEL